MPVFSTLDKERVTCRSTATCNAGALDVVVTTTDAAGEPAEGAAVLNVRALADLIGLHVRDLPDALFRCDADAECARDTSCCGARFTGEKPSFHVHFGLGRLAVGLVIPALSAGATHFAILQRPSHDWVALRDERKASKEGGVGAVPPVEVKVNNEPVTAPLAVITTADQLESALRERCPLLALSDDTEVIRKLASAATSFSCALGVAVAKVLEPILEHLDEEERVEARPILFACENDFGPVRELKTKIAKKVHVVECMVDRVCLSRNVDAKAGVVEVATEPFDGRLVVLEPMDERLVPFGGAMTMVPPDTDAAHFMYQQKFQIINGTHGIMSFMTLREHGVKADQIDGVMKEDKMALMRLGDAPRDVRAQIEAWWAMRACYLLCKFGMATIARALQTDENEAQVFNALQELIAEADRRLSGLDDTVPRVMESDPPRMLAQRLLPIRDFLAPLDTAAAPVVTRYLKAVHVDEAFARSAVNDLCDYAFAVCDHGLVDVAVPKGQAKEAKAAAQHPAQGGGAREPVPAY
ncbi:hypothetical protein JKP88DRAFT_268223 [Tribonema minus]|uniref:Mannitol dehydrogenase C-terminal domain-containing protein n=1 Tax=Tribonema minus TaxID=303371 RepID=A0A836CHK0_9STRA|nr:hypothetical protein JKP88DRAFT_268223 [Tribonema minus]